MMKLLRTRKRLVVLAVVVTLLLVVVPVAQAWPFGDVPVGYWAYNAIRRVAYLNITSGCGGGNYCPEQNVTRAQMAGFMNNLTKAYTTQNEPYILNMDHRYVGANRPAIIGRSNDGNGLEGYSYGAANANNGVYGETNSPSSLFAGVYGRSTSNATGVWGANNSGGIGVWGYTQTGFGVYGLAATNTGTNYGVVGQTQSPAGYAVYGKQANSPGSFSGWWVPGGYFSGRNGVIGVTNTSGGYAVAGNQLATTGSGIGVLGGNQTPTGWAGYFNSGAGNGVHITSPSGSTGLSVSGGSKSAVVRSDEGSRLLYSEEATEVWFNDHGFGQLQDGTALIAIDPLYAQTVNLEEPYHVFVQVYGDAEVYVSNRTAASFEVHLRDGDPNVEFSYRIMAKRLGYEGDRLEAAPWADDDPNLYPEKGTQGLFQQTDGAEAPVEPEMPPMPLEP